MKFISCNDILPSSRKTVIGIDVMGNYGVGKLEVNTSPYWKEYYDTPYCLYDEHGEISLENVIAWNFVKCDDFCELLAKYKGEINNRRYEQYEAIAKKKGD